MPSTAAPLNALPPPAPFAAGTGSGGETMSFLLAQLGEMYGLSGLSGCNLSVDNRTCATSSAVGGIDILDNYNRDEYTNGATLGADVGIGQLCGTTTTGGAAVPDIARASRSLKAGECGTAVPMAADSVVAADFPFANALNLPCTTGQCVAIQIGPVAAGWRPGDQSIGPYSGQAFRDLSDVGPSGTAGSIAERIYCETGATRITDWGQVNDASPDPAHPGQTKGTDGVGTPIGIPIYIPAVQTGSGTASTWAAFVGCANPNVNNSDGRMVHENAGAELATVAAADHPTDNIAAANQVAESLYYLSFGVSVWRQFTLFHGRRMTMNGVTPSQSVETADCTPSAGCTPIPTRRQLSLVYVPTSVRTPTASFLNWVCDADATSVNHGIDPTTGRNFSSELSTTIGTTFFFPRVSCTP